MDKSIRNATLSTLALLATLAVNALANILPINGLNTGEVSALYPSLFTPAGITFSIWSIIYLLLICFVVLQWIKEDAYVFAEISPLFWLSCLFNCLWIIAWHYLLVSISVTIMLLLLLTLVQLFLKIRKISLTLWYEKIFIRLTFTIYLAWICVATIANVATLFVSNQWDGLFLTPLLWTLVMMCVAALLAAYMTLRYRIPVFALVVSWALYGIYVRWQNGEQPSIEYLAIGLLIVLLLTSAFSFYKSIITRRLS
jgi:benzodiazapine receptor